MYMRRCLPRARKKRPLLYYFAFVFVIYVFVIPNFTYETVPEYSNDNGTYSLTIVPDLATVNYYLSLNLIVSIDETELEEQYLYFQRQSKISTPYYPQVVPLSYVLRVDSQPFELEYKIPDTSKSPLHLPYITRKIPYVVHIEKNLTRPNTTIPLLPIPHGQIFDHKNIRRFTFAVRENNITNLYMGKLGDRQLLRLQLQPLGLDQMQHHRWLFFSADDTQDLLAITNIQPHVIVKVDENTGIVHEYARTSQPELFFLLQGEQVFMGAAPILLRKKNLYLGVFHTSSRTNLFYTFSTKYPYEIKCVLLESPFEGLLSRRPITEIRLYDGKIFTLELNEISLTKMFDDIQTQCTQKPMPSPSQVLQWLPSVTPLSIDMPPFLFNPAILALPKGSLYRYLAVCRSSYDAEQHKIIHPGYKTQFKSDYWGIIVACFMNEDFTCANTPRELHLYYPIKGIMQRYNLSSEFPHNAVGAEDPRLIWSETNAPLLVYGMNALDSEHNTQTTRLIWIIDIRHVFKSLNFVLPKWYSEIPLYTPNKGVQLDYVSTVVEKNWMVFIHKSEMLIGYTILPKSTLRKKRYSFSEDSQRWSFEVLGLCTSEIESYFPLIKYENILEKAENEIVGIGSMHQGPNALLIVTTNSSFYYTIIHQRATLYDRDTRQPKSIYFMHYSATFDIELPFQWLRVSRQHIDPSLYDQSSIPERQRKFIFVTTIAFDDPVDIANGYGTLNSRILVSLGVYDRLSYVWIGPLSELMTYMRNVF